MMSALEYAFARAGTRPTLDGRPVWPVVDADELSSLRATADLFGTALERVVPDDDGCEAAAAGSAALVAYPRAELHGLAELYAHLSSRVAVQLPIDRVGTMLPDVVVCLWSDLTLELLARIHRACLERPVGLLVASTLVELRKRLLRAAAAGVLEPPADGRIVAVLGSQVASKRRDLGHPRPAAAALLHLGHGDGLDLNFTRDEVLCDVRRSSARGESGDPVAPCVRRGHCYRLHMPITAALQHHRMLSPADLHARAAVFLTCFGVTAPDTLVSPSSSLLDGLVGAASLGCVATGLGVTMPTRADLTSLTNALAEGCTIGEALYQSPHLSREAKERCQLLLFGDPRTRPTPIPATMSASVRPPESVVEITAEPNAWTHDTRMSFLLDLVKAGKDPHPEQDGDDSRFARCLDGLAPLWDHWPAACHTPVRGAHEATCPSCGRRGQSFVFRLRRHPRLRILSTCPRCGVFEDCEQGSSLTEHRPHTRGTVVEIPDAVADTTVMIRYKDEMKQSTRWTLPPGRGREQRLALPGARVRLGTGFATLNVVYLRRLEICSWQFTLEIENVPETRPTPLLLDTSPR